MIYVIAIVAAVIVAAVIYLLWKRSQTPTVQPPSFTTPLKPPNKNPLP